MKIPHPVLNTILFQGVKIHILRDDLIDPDITSSKFRKYVSLVPHLLGINKHVILKGSARSNHIRAISRYIKKFYSNSTAYFFAHLSPCNTPLSDLETYELTTLYGDNFVISKYPPLENPDMEIIAEGGFHPGALTGAQSLGIDIANLSCDFSEIYFDAGTGFSAWSAVSYLHKSRSYKRIKIISMADAPDACAKQGERIKIWSKQNFDMESVEILRPCTARSFGAMNATLRGFICDFHNEYKIPLHPLYSGKLMHTVFAHIKKGQIKSGQDILVVHSGI